VPRLSAGRLRVGTRRKVRKKIEEGTTMTTMTLVKCDACEETVNATAQDVAWYRVHLMGADSVGPERLDKRDFCSPECLRAWLVEAEEHIDDTGRRRVLDLSAAER
jgi:hypothetical protein